MHPSSRFETLLSRVSIMVPGETAQFNWARAPGAAGVVHLQTTGWQQRATGVVNLLATGWP